MAIVVVGSFTVDYTVETPRFPASGETVIGNDYKTSLGGKGANQAMAASKLGSDVCMVGAIGNDTHGDTIIEAFKSAGIDINDVERSHKATGFASITIDQSGENRIVMVPGANRDYPVSKLKDLNIIANASIVLAQLEMKIDVVDALSTLCKQYDVPFLLNPAPMHALSEQILKGVTYLTPNETELALLVNEETLHTDDAITKAAKQLIHKGVKHVIVTLGARGALHVSKESVKHYEGYSVKALDTVAAGDAFNGAFAHKIALGASIDDAIQYANATGALTVQSYGAINALPERDDVDAFLNNQS